MPVRQIRVVNAGVVRMGDAAQAPVVRVRECLALRRHPGTVLICAERLRCFLSRRRVVRVRRPLQACGGRAARDGQGAAAGAIGP